MKIKPMFAWYDFWIGLFYDKNKKIALLCSTGNRSLALAKSIRRMGYDNIWSISGGVAFSQLQFDNKIG